MGRLYRIGDPAVDVELATSGDRVSLRIGERAVDVEHFSIDERYVTVTIAGRTDRYLYARDAGRVVVAYKGRSLVLSAADEESGDIADAAGFAANIVAPMPGKVLDVLVCAGDRLDAGAPLLLLEAMKMEQTIRTAAAAVVVEVHVEAQSMVGPGQTLVTLEPAES